MVRLVDVHLNNYPLSSSGVLTPKCQSSINWGIPGKTVLSHQELPLSGLRCNCQRPASRALGKQAAGLTRQRGPTSTYLYNNDRPHHHSFSSQLQRRLHQHSLTTLSTCLKFLTTPRLCNLQSSPFRNTPKLDSPTTSTMAMFSQNPLLNGPNYSFSEAPKFNAPEGARQHRFDPYALTSCLFSAARNRTNISCNTDTPTMVARPLPSPAPTSPSWLAIPV